jgi:hypothetical protein
MLPLMLCAGVGSECGIRGDVDCFRGRSAALKEVVEGLWGVCGWSEGISVGGTRVSKMSREVGSGGQRVWQLLCSAAKGERLVKCSKDRCLPDAPAPVSSDGSSSIVC